MARLVAKLAYQVELCSVESASSLVRKDSWLFR